MKSTLLRLIAPISFVLALPCVALAGCPESILKLADFPAFHTSVARLDTTQSHSPDYPSSGRGRFDLVAGWLGESGSGAAGGSADVLASDRYTLLGPAGTVPIVARLEVRFFGNGCPTTPHGVGAVEMSAAILHGAQQTDFACASPGSSTPCASCDGTTTLTLPLAVTVGDPFEVRWHVRGTAGSNNGEEIFAQFFFDLPPGYAIESCQGYSTGAVPAGPTSWGRIKARYH